MRVARVLLLLPAFAGACGSSPQQPTLSGPVARFDLSVKPTPNFMDVPFPSDVYLQSGRVVEIPGMDAVVKQNAQFVTHELAKMDGFSRSALALFFVDDLSAPRDDDGNVAPAAIDATTLPRDEASCMADSSAVFLVDLEATDPAKARVPCRAVYHVDVSNPRARPLVAVGPARGVVLDEAHGYAAVITSRITTADGTPIQASADFQSVQRGGIVIPYASAYRSVMDAVGDALAADGAQVVAMAPYTTNAMTKQLYALRDQIEQAPAPQLEWDEATMSPMASAKFAQKNNGQLPAGFTASLDDWLGAVDVANKLPDGSDDPDGDLPVRAHDRVAAVGTAVFAAKNWLQRYGSNYSSLDDATFALDASGNPTILPDAPTSKVWVSIAVPTAPMPAGGYPAVVIQHGLGGTREDLLQLGNTLCKAGWIAVAIDSVTFGARAPEASWRVDKTSDFARGGSKAAYTGPDGFADADASGAHNGSNDLFGNLLDIGAVRDQLRQAELDTAQLVKVLRSNPDLSPLATGGTTPKIDGTRIAYVGNSLGGIEGAVAAAIEPRVSAWTLNVAGAGLILELATHSPIVYSLLEAAVFANFGFVEATLDAGHPMTTLIQTVVEPGDPIAFAGNLVKRPQPLAGQPTSARNVLQFEVVYDEWVSNEANEALARAGGWGLARPNVGSNAGVLDVKNPAANPGRVPLADVAAAQDGSIHDVPQTGVTAVVVQQSPATHGNNLTASRGQRQFCIPYADYASGSPFDHLDADKYFKVPDPYRDTQDAVVRFFGDAFAGKVPTVVVKPAPVRDLDADGQPDDQDPDPCKP